jgi:hypothetical protein
MFKLIPYTAVELANLNSSWTHLSTPLTANPEDWAVTINSNPDEKFMEVYFIPDDKFDGGVWPFHLSYNNNDEFVMAMELTFDAEDFIYYGTTVEDCVEFLKSQGFKEV